MTLPDGILVCDSAKCSGCYSCQIWCSYQHYQQCNPSLARLLIIPSQENGLFTPVICRHCQDPPCLDQCPVDAIEIDSQKGAVVIDIDKCTGCQVCIDACPYDAIRVGLDGDILKCDLCGGSPVCVENCTRQALNYLTPNDANAIRADGVCIIEETI